MKTSNKYYGVEERREIVQAYETHGRNLLRTSKALSIPRNTIRHIVQKALDSGAISPATQKDDWQQKHDHFRKTAWQNIQSYMKKARTKDMSPTDIWRLTQAACYLYDKVGSSGFQSGKGSVEKKGEIISEETRVIMQKFTQRIELGKKVPSDTLSGLDRKHPHSTQESRDATVEASILLEKKGEMSSRDSAIPGADGGEGVPAEKTR